MRRIRRLLLAGAALVLLGMAHVKSARAQDSIIVIDPDAPAAAPVAAAGPPAAVVDELIARYNDSATTRLQGDVTVPAGARFAGQLALYRGTLRLGGRVDGAVVVANGTLVLLPTAEVAGAVLVVGGRLIRETGARIDGEQRVFWDAAPVLRLPTGELSLRERRRSLGEIATARTSFRTGRIRTTLSLGTGGTYNRIEGLPVVFGPLFELRPSTRLTARLDLRGIVRTAGGGNRLRSDFGYAARAELRWSGPVALGAYGRIHSEVEPIESHPLSDSEAGWSAFLLQRDYRDYYESQGLGAGLFADPAPGLRVEASLRSDTERSVGAVDPWSLFRNSDRWRRNPLVDDGHYVTTALSLQYDTRNSRDFVTSGWLVAARVEHTTSSDAAPVSLPATVRSGIPGEDYGFERLMLDARRYLRLTQGLRVNARVRADGWLTGDRLPVQRRVSLGGPDLLPGYDFRAVSCAQRGFDDPSEPALCDRSVLAQVEVRRRLNLNLGYRLPEGTAGAGRFIGIDEADLVFFGDAGTAWLAGRGPGQVSVTRIPTLNEWKYDVGVGIDADEVGAYLAKGFSSGEPVRFLVRLQRRF